MLEVGSEEIKSKVSISMLASSQNISSLAYSLHELHYTSMRQQQFKFK